MNAGATEKLRRIVTILMVRQLPPRAGGVPVKRASFTAHLDRRVEDVSESEQSRAAFMSEESTPKPPATLGDVLYAASKAPVSEQVWVALVQSIAARDQPALHELFEMA